MEFIGLTANIARSPVVGFWFPSFANFASLASALHLASARRTFHWVSLASTAAFEFDDFALTTTA